MHSNKGEPVIAERVDLHGFETLPADHFQALAARLPLKPGQRRVVEVELDEDSEGIWRD